MDENKEKNTNVKKFVEGVFAAEDNSAATLGEKRLGNYSDIAIRIGTNSGGRYNSGDASKAQNLTSVFYLYICKY